MRNVCRSFLRICPRPGWLAIERLGTVLLFSLLTLQIEALANAAAEGTEKVEERFVEPILTEETLPNEPRELSLRLSADYRQRGGESIGALPKLELFYGLAQRLGAEMSVRLAYHSAENQAHYGLGDSSFGLKYLLVQPSTNWPAVVFGLEAGFPTGSRQQALGEGAYELEPFVAFLKEFGRLSLQGNFGWSKQLNQRREDRFTYNWAAAMPLFGRRLYVLAEINGDWGRQAQTAVAPGLKYILGKNRFIGLALPFGLNKNTPDWGIVTQFQINF